MCSKVTHCTLNSWLYYIVIHHYYNNNSNNYNRLTAFDPGQPGYAGTRRNIHPLTPIRIIVLPLSPFSICNGPWHSLYSTYVLDSPHVQPLSRSSLVFPELVLWRWHSFPDPWTFHTVTYLCNRFFIVRVIFCHSATFSFEVISLQYLSSSIFVDSF